MDGTETPGAGHKTKVSVAVTLSQAAARAPERRHRALPRDQTPNV